jgi:hypothetical protein
MTTSLPSWSRPRFQPGGGDAHLFYKVHGTFPAMPEVSRSRHRCAGVPAGCDIEHFVRERDASVLSIGLDGYFGGDLERSSPELFAAASAAEQCLVLRGVVTDPPTLDYLRDAIGVVTAMLEQGGVAVFDAHMFKWWTPDEWRERVFEPSAPVPHHHVAILVSDEADGRRWYHTRGLLKFGRPDVSVRDVDQELEPAVTDLCNRFIEEQAFGGVIAEGQEVRMASLPAGWRCSHHGDLDDPDFNNRHVDVRR